jgi:hypothetical protein
MTVAATLLDRLPAASTNGVDKLYCQLGGILTICTTQQEECSLQCRAGVSTLILSHSRAGWQKTVAEPSAPGMTSSSAWVSSQGPHGNRASAQNPRHAARPTRESWARSLNAMYETCVGVDMMTWRDTTLVLRDWGERCP